MSVPISLGSHAATDNHLDAIYRDHHTWLRSWMIQRLHCSETASDLAQDIFLRLLTKGPQYEIAEPRAFLTTVAKRTLSNHWRRDQLEKAYLEALAHQPQASVLSPEDREIILETLLEVDRLLDGLPTVVRQAFLYAQLDGLTHQQIANRLGISLSSVKRYLRRAAMQCYFSALD